MISFSNLCPFLPPALLAAQPDLCAPSGSSPLGGMSVLSLCQTHVALLQRSAAIKKLDFFYSSRIELRFWRGIEPPHTPTVTWSEQEEVTAEVRLTPVLDWEI